MNYDDDLVYLLQTPLSAIDDWLSGFVNYTEYAFGDVGSKIKTAEKIAYDMIQVIEFK